MKHTIIKYNFYDFCFFGWLSFHIHCLGWLIEEAGCSSIRVLLILIIYEKSYLGTQLTLWHEMLEEVGGQREGRQHE